VRVFLMVLMLVFAWSALGQAEVRCGTAERFAGKLIKVGDSVRRVIEAGPDREVRLETRFGGAAGYRFEFYKYGRTVHIYTSGGVVTRVCRVSE